MSRNWSLIATRLEREQPYLTLAAAAKIIPSHRGKGTSQSTLRTWILRGRHGVFLDGVRGSNGWLTTRDAITRFLTESSEHAAAQVVTPVLQSERERRSEAARLRMLA